MHEIIYNHNYLLYYPSTKLLMELTQYYNSIKNVEAMVDLAKIYSNSLLLKIDNDILNTLVDFGVENKANSVLYYVAKICVVKQLKELNDNIINKVLFGLARHQLEHGN